MKLLSLLFPLIRTIKKTESSLPLLSRRFYGGLFPEARRRLIVGVGNSVDHYISSLWLFLGPVLGERFFPAHDPLSQLCYTYGAFAVAYILKPAGAVFFSYQAQAKGAWRLFPYPLLGAGCGACLLGLFSDAFLSSYGIIGLWMVKACCNFFISGETQLSRLIFLKEAKKDLVKEGSLFELSTLLGIMAAAAASLSLYASPGNKDLWPLLFCGGGGVALLGAVLRSFERGKGENKQDLSSRFSFAQIVQNLYHSRLLLFRLALMTGTSYAIYSFSCVFMTIIAPHISSVSQAQALQDSLLLHAFDGVCLWGFGHLFSEKKLIQWMKGSLWVLLMSFLILPVLTDTGNPSYLLLYRFWVVGWAIIFLLGLNPYVMRAVQNDKNGPLLVGVGFSLGAISLGRPTTFLCVSLWSWGDTPAFLPIIWMGSLCVLSLLVLKKKKEPL